MSRPNRYDQSVNFVAPYSDTERRNLAAADVVRAYRDTGEPHPTNIDAVWTPTESRGTRDSVSAQDRALGLQRRMAIVAIIGAGIALAVVVAYTATLIFFRLPDLLPFLLDRLLLFLMTWGGLLLWAFGTESQRDYDHSHAGVERLRIIEAAELRREELRQEAALRRQALELSLKLLEDRNRDR